MSDLIFQVCIGKRTRLYDWGINSCREYAKKIGAQHRVLTEPLLKIRPNPATSGRSDQATEPHGCLPIFEKCNAWPYLTSFERVAVIDSDIYVRPGSPSIFEQLGDADFAAVRERDNLSTPKHERKVRQYSRSMFGGLGDVDWEWENGSAGFYNMGVELMGGEFLHHLKTHDPKEFLSREEWQPFIDGVGSYRWSTDQVLKNYFVRKSGMKVKALDRRWNTLYGASLPKAIKQAHFIHFYLSAHLPQRGENVELLAASILAVA